MEMAARVASDYKGHMSAWKSRPIKGEPDKVDPFTGAPLEHRLYHPDLDSWGKASVEGGVASSVEVEELHSKHREGQAFWRKATEGGIENPDWTPYFLRAFLGLFLEGLPVPHRRIGSNFTNEEREASKHEASGAEGSSFSNASTSQQVQQGEETQFSSSPSRSLPPTVAVSSTSDPEKPVLSTVDLQIELSGAYRDSVFSRDKDGLGQVQKQYSDNSSSNRPSKRQKLTEASSKTALVAADDTPLGSSSSSSSSSTQQEQDQEEQQPPAAARKYKAKFGVTARIYANTFGLHQRVQEDVTLRELKKLPAWALEPVLFF
jgi:hypothetical protein